MDARAPHVGVHHDDEAIGTLISRLVNDTKTYAAAEVGVVKATASARVAAAKTGAILLVVALLLAISAVGALIVGLIMSLATLVGPLAATGIVVVVTFVIAGILALTGIKGLQRAWRIGA